MRGRIKCFIGEHDWERIGSIQYVKISEWNENFRVYAYGRCRRCNKKEPRVVAGQFTVSGTYITTMDKAIEKWEKQLGRAE